MARFPIMPVIVDRLLADTEHLDPAQFGCYMRLLLHAWRHNAEPMPDDDARMARIVRLTPARWRKVRPILAEFFTIEDGHWRQPRLEAEWRRAIEISSTQSARAKKRWDQKPIPFARHKSLNSREAPDAAADAPPIHKTSIVAVPPEPSPQGDEVSQKDEPSLSNPESVAVREGEKDEGTNPVGRCAPLVACHHRRRSSKSPGLKLKVRQQLASKHCRFLKACGRPDELGAYFEAMAAGEGGIPEQRYFDAIDRRMREARWDDMRWWRDRQARPDDENSAEAMMLRKGWFHGRSAA